MRHRSLSMVLVVASAVSITLSAAASDPPEEPAAAAAAVGEMKQYWFVMLSRGAQLGEPLSDEQRAELQAGHMAHMAAEHAAGRLVLAGPFGDDGDWRGIQIYDAGSKDEVEAICAQDPAVAAGRLACSVHPWWGQVGTSLK